MIKKRISTWAMVLGLVWVMGLASLAGAGTYSGGSGTEADPYQLADPNDWLELVATSGDWSAHFVLTADIDMAGVSGLTPLGDYNNRFTGSLDGAGHVFANVTINLPAVGKNGLFGAIGSGGAIANLGLENASITGDTAVGALVGFLEDGTVTNCHATGSVTGGGNYVGGLIGRNRNGGLVSGCYADCQVTSPGDGVGGLLGENYQATVNDSYAIGPVTGYNWVGGLMGYCYVATVSRCFATGSVTGDNYVGGLVGDQSSGTVSASFWDTQTSGQSSSAGGTGKTTAEMKQQATFTAAGWDFVGETANGTEDIWAIKEGSTYPRFPWQPWYSGGTGDPCDPYQLADPCDWTQLMTTSCDWNAHFVLTADIDLAGVSGLTPVGDSGTTFTGTLDGHGHVISNATINLPASNSVGLFGRLGSGGEIANLGVENVDVTGDDTVGGLVGASNGGTVRDCYATGSVTGDDHVGGLVGYNFNCTVSGCYATGSVTGDSHTVGGLVGANSSSSTVSDCYANSSVAGDSSVGGLVGVNVSNCTVSDCYATGSVTGDYYIGGLVGYLASSVRDCYAASLVTGNTSVGGLVGRNTGGVVFTSFWDVDTTGWIIPGCDGNTTMSLTGSARMVRHWMILAISRPGGAIPAAMQATTIATAWILTTAA